MRERYDAPYVGIVVGAMLSVVMHTGALEWLFILVAPLIVVLATRARLSVTP
jgi:hypothetical protein